jgi:crotonobetainyl-CoA:carnitine CoA-transferase CaiB-like acyl-CoA transferase
VDVPSSKGDGSTFPSPASPVRFPGADDGPKGPSPKLGEHTRDVLERLGLPSGDIDALYADGVVK